MSQYTESLFLPTLGKYEDKINSYLQLRFNISGKRAGDDFLLTNKVLTGLFKNVKPLKLHHEIILSKTPRPARSYMYPMLDIELKMFEAHFNLKLPPEKKNNLGILSEITAALNNVAIASDEEVIQKLEDTLLPVFNEKLGATHLSSVTINARTMQALIALPKIALLLSRFDFPKAKELTETDRPFDGVLPSGFDPLFYLEALTRISPFAFTLPAHRHNCSWHFYKNDPWHMGNDACNSLFAQFMTSSHPLADKSNLTTPSDILNIKGDVIWKFLRFLVSGINRLMVYVSDCRNFADQDGRVDLLKQLQAHSAIKLIFADLGSMNYSTESHQKISFSMSVIDKLANIRCQLGKNIGRDADAFKGLLSHSQKESLRHSVNVHCRTFGYTDLARYLENFINEVYAGILDKSSFPDWAILPESQKLDYIYSQRNLRHGSFLSGGQFEKLFLSSKGTAPATIGALSFALVLGLISDPSGFLKFTPKVEQSTR